MKLVIAGSRTINLDAPTIASFVRFFKLFPDEIVSGCADGIDKCGEDLADRNVIPIKRFPADWDKHGRAAGPIRNASMAEYADALLLIWDGTSRGSASMRSEMKKLNKPIYEVILNEKIHHINFIRDDNRLENLYLCKNSSQHMKLHGALNGLNKELFRHGIIIFSNGKYEIAKGVINET